MRRRVSAAVVYFCVASITVLAQTQAPPPIRAQAFVLEIRIVEIIGAQPDEIERIGNSREHLNRLINEGKAKLTASLYVRTRAGESFSARVGQRVPIQTAAFPAFRTGGDARRGTSQAVPPDTAIFPQIEYEQTGLSVEGSSIMVDDTTLDIRFNIEMSGLDTSTGKLTPTFMTRSLKNIVRMKRAETAIPIGLIQQEPPPPTSATDSTAGGPSLSRGSFIVLLTTKPVQ